ncbi:MAG: hypothetical protein ACT4OO_07145 [Nitrospiraceae bacterium]
MNKGFLCGGKMLLLGASLGFVSGFIAPVNAAEFYSWIDPSGTMVLTDDASQIPSPRERSPVTVRHYRDMPVTVSEPVRHPSGSLSVPQPQKDSRDRQAAMLEERPRPVDPADVAVPAVLLDEPTQAVADQYHWVPLSGPIFLSSRSIYGFWSHRMADNPARALEQHLHSLAASLGLQRGSFPKQGSPAGSFSGGLGAAKALPPSGNPVSDQVLRERQALIERNFLLHQATQQEIARLSPLCCGKVMPPAGAHPGRPTR